MRDLDRPHVPPAQGFFRVYPWIESVVPIRYLFQTIVMLDSVDIFKLTFCGIFSQRNSSNCSYYLYIGGCFCLLSVGQS